MRNKLDAIAGELNMADLTEWYPAPAQSSPNGAGRPSAPATVATPSGIGGAPAIWVLVLAGASLFLLHQAG